MRFKVGDEVRIKSDLTECDHDEGGCYLGDADRCSYVVSEMVEERGNKVTIKSINSSGIMRFEVIGCAWTTGMVEPLEKEKEKGKYKIIMTKEKEELVMITEVGLK